MSNLMADTFERKITLAMGAMYIEEAYLIAELLETFDPDTEDPAVLQSAVDEGFLRIDMNYGDDVKENAIEILGQMWEIESSEDLLDMMDFLKTQGHRGKFKAMVKHLDDREKFKQIFEFDFGDLEELQMSESDFDKLVIWLRKAMALIEGPEILAWDLARAVHLVRLGILADLLTEQQAWDYIDSLYPLAKGKFKDWKHFAQSYLIGLTFWAGQEDPIVKGCCERLFGELKVSPWGYYSWSQTSV